MVHLMKNPPKKELKQQILLMKKLSRNWLDCEVAGCPFWTNKRERMERHMTCHPNKLSKSLQCPDCGVEFRSLTKMLKHDRLEHTGVKDYECRICGVEVTDIMCHAVKVH